MPNPVVHWEIAGKDGTSLQTFYARLFGWHVDANNPISYGLVDTHAEGGINGGIETSRDGSKGVIIYVQVDDLAASLREAERLGGKTVTPPTEVPGMVTFAHFQDPEGNVIGLVKA